MEFMKLNIHKIKKQKRTDYFQKQVDTGRRKNEILRNRS